VFVANNFGVGIVVEESQVWPQATNIWNAEPSVRLTLMRSGFGQSLRHTGCECDQSWARIIAPMLPTHSNAGAWLIRLAALSVVRSCCRPLGPSLLTVGAGVVTWLSAHGATKLVKKWQEFTAFMTHP
jgi:hypothetical protein